MPCEHSADARAETERKAAVVWLFEIHPYRLRAVLASRLATRPEVPLPASTIAPARPWCVLPICEARDRAPPRPGDAIAAIAPEWIRRHRRHPRYHLPVPAAWPTTHALPPAGSSREPGWPPAFFRSRPTKYRSEISIVPRCHRWSS